MGERFFVIGSNTFTGATFIAAALAEGAEIIGCSRSEEAPEVFLPYRWGKSGEVKRFRFEQLDLNHHLDRLLSVVRDFRPDYVVNFAAQSMVAESWLHPDHWYQTNVVANVRLHEALRKVANLRRYVHVSTPEVYGSCSGRVTEDAPLNPSTPYAASRAACDLHLATFFKQYQFPVVSTRAANVYGPGQRLYRIIPRTILFAKTGRRLPLHGGGRSVRSFVHARDIADGTLRVARQGRSGEVYHFSTDCYVSIRELVERICAKLGVPFEEVVEPVGDRPGKDAAYLLDSQKARAELGWADRIPLDAGIAETVDWVSAHLETLQQQPLDYIHKP